MTGAASRPAAAVPRSLVMLGMGWFPDQPGGLNRYFRDLHMALLRDGEAPTALVVGPARERPARVVTAAHGSSPLPWRLLAYSAAARRLRRDAGLLDAHFALYAAQPVSLARRRRRPPLVVHFHGPWADEAAEGGERQIAVAAKRMIERAVYRRADRLVVLSSAFRRILVERYGVLPWRVDVIPPGIDLEGFTPDDGRARERLGLERGRWMLVTVRRLVPRMGLDGLLRAWAELARNDGPPGLLAIVGEGPLRPHLESLAGDLGVASSVRFLGRVDDESLRDWYRAADLCVVPSVALEGFGLVVLESLACGTPTLVSDVGGLPEAVRGLDGDLVLAAGDRGALTARLRRARDRPQELPSPTACRAHAERFTWRACVERHRQAYSAARYPASRRRLRVVFIDHCAALAGGELALLRTLPTLDRIDAHVILAEEGPLVARLVRQGVSVEVLPMAERARGLRRERVTPSGLGPGAALSTAAHVITLARRLRRLAPDLVETNSLKAALYGAAAARLAGVPIVWHLRDRLAEDYLPRAAARAARAAARRMPDGIIANSHATRSTLPAVACPVDVIPSPVQVLPLGSGEARRNGDPFSVGMVGRIAPWKGQHLFLEGFARAFEGGDERAVVVGAPLFGEEGYERRLYEEVARLGLGDRVVFRGFREDVAAELSRVDVLVHSSVIPEPLGQTVLEGMAAGVPVVVPDVGGPAELVSDGVNGLVYRVGDAGALAQALRRLKAEPELRTRLGAAGRRSAQELSPEAVAERIYGFYERVLARADRRRRAP